MKKKKYIFITFLIIIIDQLTKFLINQNINYLKSIQIIKNFFYFTNAHNNGAAFSILSGYNLLFISIKEASSRLKYSTSSKIGFTHL